MKPLFNRNKIALHVAIALTAGALFAGCAGNGTKKTAQTEPSRPEVEKTLTVAAADGMQAVVTNVETDKTVKTQEENPAAPVIPYPDIDIAEDTKPEQLTFQFGFDKSELTDQDKEVIKQHAKYLIDNPSTMIKIVGHTDHHGPKAYNEFLSKKRANSIAKILIEEGVAESQIQISAMANDEPLLDVADTRKNRRVELNYIDMNMATTH